MNTLCDALRSTLILIDLQARLMPAVDGGDNVVQRAMILAQAARQLGVPVIGTEQNPEKLGHNIPAIRSLCDVTIAKSHFDACARPQLSALLDPRRDELIVAGCEAHVCVLQTALGLMRTGYQVRLVTDAIGSRHAHDRVTAIDRARTAGAGLVTSEMVLFEWLRHSNHPEFRDIIGLIK
ncbi:MAG TPA: isochorismatase family protein [Salinisphaeraceae bacterium]|nr:isochorismatase family protein [Salinisphaeraceae bacterium]